jgi:curved DNA-binding protein CbpA
MDLYIVLGVERDAETGEIKRAYKRLARRLHPDINPGDREAAARFRQILDAYETLIDPDRRRRYDAGQLTASATDGTRRGHPCACGVDLRRGLARRAAQRHRDAPRYVPDLRRVWVSARQRNPVRLM